MSACADMPTYKDMITEFAPAKINLYLHITGRDGDGYHALDSLVAFAGAGDDVRLQPSSKFSFTIEGPQAKALSHESAMDNLVVRAAQSLAELTGRKLDVALTLVKNLPVASGIGGGSSDAAAVLRALAKYWGLQPTDPRVHQAAVCHGQDVPVCLKIENNYMTATGTIPAPDLPYADILLVNPGKVLPTAQVYNAYRNSAPKFSFQAQITEAPQEMGDLIAALKVRNNDLYKPARALMPEIATIINALDASGSLLSRMSGSGATCFAFYADRGQARQAAASLYAAHPDWWVAQSYIPYRTDPRRKGF